MKIPKEDILKAIRKGSRDAELEVENGFVSRHKIHRSKKQYRRKAKHQKELN